MRGKDLLGDGPVEVVPYDPSWPQMFDEERGRILDALGSRAVGIEHVGSTAVPGLCAKPVIDIMVGVRTLDEAPKCVGALEGLGYEYVPGFEVVVPERRYFRRFDVAGRRTHQIHLVERRNLDWWGRHVRLRDYLRAHPEVAREYGELKTSLARRFRHDRAGYMDGKDGFIRVLERRALEGSG